MTKDEIEVRHAVLEHRDAVDAHAPGEALHRVGVEAAMAQHAARHPESGRRPDGLRPWRREPR
jgi:hypothetical protein